MDLLIFREELNKKQNFTTNRKYHARFSAKGNKKYAGIFFYFWILNLIERLSYLSSSIIDKLEIEYSIFLKSSDEFAWEHIINQTS